MLRKCLRLAMVASMLTGANAVWAQGNADTQDQKQKRTLQGPSTTAFGPWQVVLPDGATAEVEYQPDTSRIVIKTLAKDARLITSARNLVVVENQDGTVEVTLANGRKIKIKPTNVEIVGRAIVDDPGQILIFVAGSAVGVVSTDLPAAALVGVVTSPTPFSVVTHPRPEGVPEPISPSQPLLPRLRQ